MLKESMDEGATEDEDEDEYVYDCPSSLGN